MARKLQSKDNAGARALRRMFPKHGGAAHVADTIGANRAAVARWFIADTTPSTKWRFALLERFDVSPLLFDQPLPVPYMVEPEADESADTEPAPAS